MSWLTWRQHRSENLIGGLILLLFAILLLVTGRHVSSVFHSSGAAICLDHHTANSSSCSQAIDAFQARFSSLDNLRSWFNLLPGLLGALLAAPFVLELDQGTFRLAWTQSITRRRWLATRLGLIAVGVLLASSVMTALLTWWRGPFDQIGGRLQPNVFDFEGVAPFAYTLFAAAVVLAIGALTRRTAVAVAAGFGVYIGLRLAVQAFARQHFLSPMHAIATPSPALPPSLSHAWVLSHGFANQHGQPLANIGTILRACLNPTTHNLDTACLSHHGVVNLIVYQPASRFWLLQGIEGGIFTGLALVLGFLATWSVSRRLA